MNTQEPYQGTYDIDILPNCPALLTIAEVSEICGISKQTVERMIEQGLLNTNAFNEIPRKDLKKYINTHSLADIPLM